MIIYMLRLYFIFTSFLLFSFIQSLSSSNQNELIQLFPRPNSNYNTVLGMILAFNFDHIDPLVLIMSQYQSMCEGYY